MSGIMQYLDNKDALFITFGGIYEGFDVGMPPFEFSRSLSSKGCDLVFIRDLEQAWYQFGAKDVGKNIDEVAAFLKPLRQRYKRIITIGNSMGGYASLLIGSMIGADVCVAIGAQTFIDPVNRKRYKDNRWKEQMARFHAVAQASPYYDLKAYFESTKELSPKAFILFYGKASEIDVIHATRMEQLPKFHLIEVMDAMHNACKVMRESGIISRVIDNVIADSDVESLLAKMDSEKQLKRKLPAALDS